MLPCSTNWRDQRLRRRALNTAYAEADAKDTKTILLNFERVDYINSTGIALIVGLLAKALLTSACLPAT